MLEYAKEKNYRLHFSVVDPWNNVGNVGSELVGENVYKEFLGHLFACKDRADIGNVHKMTSLEAAKLYEDNSLDFVFLDDDHDDWACYDGLVAWYSKVKAGGTIAGHDADQPSVSKSVRRFCEENGLTSKLLGGSVQVWVIEK